MYIHTYKHTYIHACMHTYIHTYMHAYIFQVFIGTMQTNLINLHAVAFIYAFC